MHTITSLRNSIKSIWTGKFSIDVLSLSAGTLGGRLIAFLALPFLTRIYTPDEFGVFAAFIAAVTMIGVIMCLRYEIAIPFAKDTKGATSILMVSLAVIPLMVLVIFGLYLLATKSFGYDINLFAYTDLVIGAAAMAGLYSALQHWATKQRNFRPMAKSKVVQSLVTAIVSLGLGLIGLSGMGLMVGSMAGFLSASVFLGMFLAREITQQADLAPQQLLRTAAENKRYPIYSAPEALINAAGLQLSVIVIAALSEREAGFLLLAMQIMTTPMHLLGTSISQVYMSRVQEHIDAHTLSDITLRLMRKIAYLGTGPIILVGFAAPVLFPMIFGAEWVRAGEIVLLLAPSVVLQFISSPMSMAIYARGKQNRMLMLTLGGLVLRLGGVLLLWKLFPGQSPIAGFAIGSFLYYIAVLLTVCHTVGFSRVQYGQFIMSFLSPVTGIAIALCLFLT